MKDLHSMPNLDVWIFPSFESLHYYFCNKIYDTNIHYMSSDLAQFAKINCCKIYHDSINGKMSALLSLYALNTREPNLNKEYNEILSQVTEWDVLHNDVDDDNSHIIAQSRIIAKVSRAKRIKTNL